VSDLVWDLPYVLCTHTEAHPLVNGGPTGIPTPGVNITDITMRNIYGTVQSTAYNYYILVATPSTNAASWTFENVYITGGNASCDSVPAGFDCKSSLRS
jgi:polygalacturonase